MVPESPVWGTRCNARAVVRRRTLFTPFLKRGKREREVDAQESIVGRLLRSRPAG